MPYQIGDVTIGHFDRLKEFGVMRDIYHARYNLEGHNGVDFACPNQTPVLSGAPGKVIEAQFDSNAYGNVIKILHSSFLTTYAHLNDIAVKTGDTVVSGQLIGHSNSTGLSDNIPHLHFGVAPCDENGNKLLKDNGYGGYIDPIGPEVEWVIKNLTEPVYPSKVIDPALSISSSELSTKEINNNNYITIMQFARGNGLDDFLNTENEQLADLDVNGGQKVNMWISELLLKLRDAPKQPQISESPVKKGRFLGSVSRAIRNYIFIQKL